MANLRFGAVEEAFKKRPLEVAAPTERPGEFYGKYVFNRTKMYKYLPVTSTTSWLMLWITVFAWTVL